MKETLVAHGDDYRILYVLGKYHVFGYLIKRHGKHVFPFVGFVQRHAQPENGADEKEQQENQKLLIESSKQEIPDFRIDTRCGRIVHH
jgi:hypothetical protein